jgi:hypothetical protein
MKPPKKPKKPKPSLIKIRAPKVQKKPSKLWRPRRPR